MAFPVSCFEHKIITSIQYNHLTNLPVQIFFASFQNIGAYIEEQVKYSPHLTKKINIQSTSFQSMLYRIKFMKFM